MSSFKFSYILTFYIRWNLIRHSVYVADHPNSMSASYVKKGIQGFHKNTLMRHHSTILYSKTEVRRFKRYSSNSALKLRLWVLETTMYLLSRNRKDIAIIHEKITAIKTL